MLPWHGVGIDPAVWRASRTVLTQSRDELARAIFTKPETLPENGKLLRNTQHLLRDVTVGTPAAPLPMAAIVAPTLCTVADQYVAFVMIRDIGRNEVAGIAHRVMARKSGLKSVSLTELYQQARKQAQSFNGNDTGDALQIGTSLSFRTTRADHGSSLCLDLLFAEKLTKAGYRVFSPVGNEWVQALRREQTTVGSPVHAGRRSSRRLIFAWTAPAALMRRSISLPLTYRLRLNYGEGVFGGVLPEGLQTDIPMAVRDEQIDFAIPPAITDFLDQERSNLQLADLPHVIRVYKGWVYLDRGRAWGLKMDDRLVSTDGQSAGHVIGFFDDEWHLKNAAGSPIHEGAILFIRKGQASEALGQTYQFDMTQYPTPWPPK